MKLPFATHSRIRARIKALLTEQQDIKEKMNGLKKTLNPEAYCKLSVKVGDIQRIIDELENLLK